MFTRLIAVNLSGQWSSHLAEAPGYTLTSWRRDIKGVADGVSESRSYLSQG